MNPRQTHFTTVKMYVSKFSLSFDLFAMNLCKVRDSAKFNVVIVKFYVNV